MISKIWRWLKKLWFNLNGYYRSTNIDQPWAWEQNSRTRSSSSNKDSDSHSIKDQDLAFLFHQLLEGVVNGWRENRIEHFFERLEPRITTETWLDWLQKYRTQLLSSSAPNYQTAARMIILGEMTASMPFVRPVGDLAYQIGEELLDTNNNLDDNLLVQSIQSYLPPKKEEVSPLNPESEQLPIDVTNKFLKQSNYSLTEVLHLLQTDEEFATQTATRLGIQTDDAGIILEQLIKKSDANRQNEYQQQQNKSDMAVDETETFFQVEHVEKATIIEQPQNITADLMSSDSASKYPLDWLDNWFKSGLEKVKEGDFEGAVYAWDQLLEADPTIAQAWHNRGSALAYLQRFSEAIESFDQSIAININDSQSWNDRGNVLYNLRRWEEAVISWDRVIGIQPDNYMVWYRKGLALEKLESWQEAISSYEQCLQIKPDFLKAQSRLEKLNNRF